MNKELETRLENTFPFMKKVDNDTDYSELGCECGDGWYDLIHVMCKEISDFYCQSNLPVDLIVYKVSKDYAALSFYFDFKNEHDENFIEQVFAIVEKYERKSVKFCEICGKRSRHREVCAKWSQSLCDKCLIKEVENSPLIDCNPGTMGYSTSKYFQILNYVREFNCVSYSKLCDYAKNNYPGWIDFIKANPRLIVMMMGKYGRSVVHA